MGPSTGGACAGPDRRPGPRAPLSRRRAGVKQSLRGRPPAGPRHASGAGRRPARDHRAGCPWGPAARSGPGVERAAAGDDRPRTGPRRDRRRSGGPGTALAVRQPPGVAAGPDLPPPPGRLAVSPSPPPRPSLRGGGHIMVTSCVDVHQHLIPGFYRAAPNAAGIGAAGGRALPDWSPEAALAHMGDPADQYRDPVGLHARGGRSIRLTTWGLPSSLPTTAASYWPIISSLCSCSMASRSAGASSTVSYAAA